MKRISFVFIIIFILIIPLNSLAVADYTQDNTILITTMESNFEDSVISILYRSDITLPQQLFTDLTSNCSYYITISTTNNKFYLYTYRMNATTTREWSGNWNVGDESIPTQFYDVGWINQYTFDTSTSTPSVTYSGNRFETSISVPSVLFNQFSINMSNVLVYFGYAPASSATTDITNSVNSLNSSVQNQSQQQAQQYNEFSKDSVTNESSAVISNEGYIFTDNNNTDSFLTSFMNLFKTTISVDDNTYTITIPMPHNMDNIVLSTAPIQQFYTNNPQIANLISIFWLFIIGRYFLGFGLRLLNWMRGEEGENGFSVSTLSKILGNYNVITRDILFM